MSLDATKAFNYEPLEKELGKESTRTLAKMFLEDTGDLVLQFQQAVKEQDAERVRMLAHMLKGGCRSIIALPSEEFCEALEDSAARADWPAISVGVNALQPMYDNLRKSLLEYLESNAED